MTRKMPQVLTPSEPDPTPQLHSGWGRSKRKMDTAGAVKTEMARLYKRAASGYMTPEDLKAAIWACRQIVEVAEAAELEAKIEELERKLAEVVGHGL